MNYTLIEIERFPADIPVGVLYWSKEFKMCAHRCACGCGDVIQLPVDEQNYRISEEASGPTLRPSVGNWGVCDAHYFITRGSIEWMPEWSPGQIAAGRAAEDSRRAQHYADKRTWRDRMWSWLFRVLNWFRRSS